MEFVEIMENGTCGNYGTNGIMETMERIVILSWTNRCRTVENCVEFLDTKEINLVIRYYDILPGVTWIVETS